MRKKILLPLLLLCIGGFMAGCNSQSSSTETPSAVSVTLNKEDVTIDMYQEYWLVADYAEGATPVWTVADPSIVSVENGKLIGLKAGATTVTVTVGEATDTCAVTVEDYKAEKLSVEFSETNVSLYKADQKQITPIIKYAGAAISPTYEKKYESTNEAVVSVDGNGKLTAKDYGNATVVATYEIGETELSAAINVEVVSSGKVEITQSYIAMDVSEANKTLNLTAKVYEKGVENTAASIVWSVPNGQDVVTLTGGVLTADNAGETTVTATYVDKEGVTKTDTVAVVVSSIQVDSGKSIVVSKDDCPNGYAIDLAALTGDEATVTGGYILSEKGAKTVLPFADGIYNLSALEAGEKELYVQTRNKEYKIGLELWTATLFGEEEFLQLLTATSGWYRLGEDITLTGEWKHSMAVEFKGLFDGDGHSVNFSTATGLFYTLSGNATVKNVTLNATVNGGGAIAGSIANGGDVTIENVVVNADVWGTNNGGLIGNVSGKATVKNAKGVVRRANDSDANGAIFGTASYAPTFENVSVYSPLPLCGSSLSNNSQAAALNALTGIVIEPTVLEDLYLYVEIEAAGKAGIDVKFTNGEYVSYTVYGNAIREVNAATTGTVAIYLSDVVNRKSISNQKMGGSVEVLFEKADGSFDYYSMPLDYAIYLTNDNFKDYLYSTSKVTIGGYYELTEDISLAGTWKTKVTFTGILDGEGYKITDLTPASQTGLFNIVQGATIRNLAVVDVVITMGSGAFAYQCYAGTTTFENVYVSLAPQMNNFHSANGKTTNDYDDLESRGKTAFVADVYAVKSEMILKNCVAYMPEYIMEDLTGIVASYSKGIVALEDCTLIGGNGLIVGMRSTKNYTPKSITVNGQGVVHGTRQGIDAVTAYQTISAKAEADRTFAEKAFLANHTYVELNGANFVEKWATLTDEIVVLTEDLDFAAAEGETGYVTNGASFATGVSAVNFYGVFDGQGHKISNLTRAYETAGAVFFNKLGGSFKNVALINFSVSSTANVAILAADAEASKTTHIENVFIEAVKLSTGDSVASVLCVTANGALSLKNVAAYCHGENSSETATLIGYLTKEPTTVAVANTYFVNEWETETVEAVNVESASYQQTASVIDHLLKLYGDGGVKGYVSYNAFYDEAYSKLPETLQAWLS